MVKKILCAVTAVIMLFSLAGCAKYSSKYMAVGFVHSNEAKKASMSFYTFEGSMVFKLDSDKEGDIKFSAKLEEGNAAVYYDYYGEKEELFTLKSGDEISARGGYVEKGTVYIIVETDGRCLNGNIDISID